MITIDAAVLEPKHQLPFLPEIGIALGRGRGPLVPSRKSDFSRLGLRAVAAGTLANFMSACIAGLLV